MSLSDFIFKKLKRENPAGRDVFKVVTGYSPAFRTWDGRLYESELIRESVDAVARNASKLEIVVQGTAKPGLQSKLKLGANQWQSWSKFLYQTSTILQLKNNAIIVPVIDEYGDTSGVATVYSENMAVVDYEGQLWLRMQLNNGVWGALPLDQVGILTRHQYKNDFFGESNSALNPTMELLNIQRQGIQEGVKNSASYKFMATLSNFSNAKDLAREREAFTQENLAGANKNGVLLWPNTYKDVKQIDVKPYVADAEQIKLINTNVFNYFGVNEKILQNSAIGDDWNAFYEGAIEPFSIMLSQELTRMLFTVRERQQGTFVMATANRLQFMSNADKANVTQIAGDRGIFTINEIRAIWNLPPLPGEEGDVRPVRGEYYNANDMAASEGGQNNAS